ncbi:MAG TPA: L-threonylcarbamoyladenylate synthase [Candidatus Saccharimonadales bacterium]
MRIFSSVEDPELLRALQDGAVGVVPSDTVYGLMASAKNPAAVTRMYALKHREHKPGTIIAASAAQFVALGLDEEQLNAVKEYWPGPLSIVITAGPELGYLHQDIGSLAARVPADEKLRALLEQTGPLITSSANEPGLPPAVNLTEAQQYFGDQVDFYVDGGDLSGRAPSTVVRITDGKIEVLRQGAAQIKEGNYDI